MATKSDKAAALEKQTALIQQEAGRDISTQATKQKLLELLTAKVSVPQQKSFSWMPLILLLLFLGVGFVWYKSSDNKNG